jgi:enoyl-CoA hydratase/carnithine racemase
MTHCAVSIDGRGVAMVVIESPPINLMTVEMLIELFQVSERLAVDDDARVVVLRSANSEWFISHFDVEAILEFPSDQPDPTELNVFHQMCETFRTMPKPTIAIVEGRVGGGGSELVSSCDMRFATPDAIFNQPEVAIGILPGGGGTVRLPRLVGRGRAMEVVLGCDDIDAATADRWGWINRVLPVDEIHPFVDRLAGRVASYPAHAVAAAKECVIRADAGISEQLLAESAAFNATLGDDETRSRMERFLAMGGQTARGERRLGDLAGEL